MGGRRSRDRMIVVFTTLQLPMQSVPITTDVVGSNFDLIKLVCDLRQIGGSPNKTDRHDITEILLKVALNTIKQQTNILLCIIYVLSSVLKCPLRFPHKNDVLHTLCCIILFYLSSSFCLRLVYPMLPVSLCFICLRLVYPMLPVSLCV